MGSAARGAPVAAGAAGTAGVIVRAPAKINLGLRVLGRRGDGYHELESLFLPLDLADAVEVAPRPEAGVVFRLEGESGGVPAGAENLAARAARAFAEAAALEGGLRVRLRKRIPAAAGLGGGSSDAGAVLRALAVLYPQRLRPEELRALALALGADVPFFLEPRPAWVRGIGERIEPARAVPSLALLLTNPGLPLATAEVYRAWDALAAEAPAAGAHPAPRSPGSADSASGAAASASASVSPTPASPQPAPPGWIALCEANDLEAAAVRLCPPIARWKRELRRAGALGVGLSGSGPTLFGLFPSRGEAERAARALAGQARSRSRGSSPGRQDHPWLRVARTLPSPAA